MHKYVVLSDFDDTIAEDLSFIIYTNFASVGLFYADLWSQGLISTPEEIVKTFETIDVSPDELAEKIRQAQFDPDFPEFVRLCTERDYEVAIVSDGLEWAIQTLLNHHGVHNLDVYANQIRFVDNGYEFSFPWRDERFPHAGVCKPKVIAKFHAEGKRVIYIGDGKSDHDAIHEADIVYAKDQLLEYCREEDVPAIPFQDFNNLVDAIKSGKFPVLMP
jgi:2-hydroxy-3-keto-5-methylthiopentenyl-1-phosphate phosphatase